MTPTFTRDLYSFELEVASDAFIDAYIAQRSNSDGTVMAPVADWFQISKRRQDRIAAKLG